MSRSKKKPPVSAQEKARRARQSHAEWMRQNPEELEGNRHYSRQLVARQSRKITHN